MPIAASPPTATASARPIATSASVTPNDSASSERSVQSASATSVGDASVRSSNQAVDAIPCHSKMVATTSSAGAT
jgi:hypothetical protein